MKMHEVSYFLALCEEQSFTRAAKRCGVTQPSLTRAIKQLEQEFGGLLFDRTHAGNKLTGLGSLVRSDLARIDRCVMEAKRKAERYLTAPLAPARQPRTMEMIMRVLAIGIATIAIALMGLTLRPAPEATAAMSAPASSVVPSASQSTPEPEALPDLTRAGLF